MKKTFDEWADDQIGPDERAAARKDLHLPPDTGYEGAEDPPPPGPVKWRVEVARRHYMTSRIVAQVMRNGQPVGLLYLDDEEDLEWLKKRLTAN